MIRNNVGGKVAALLAGVTLAALSAERASADVVFEDLPTSTTIPPNISWHNTNGPIIADDFVATHSGGVDHVTWWGTQASSNDFEIVLQDNNGGEPGLTPAGNILTGGLKQFVTATSSLYNAANGIWQFDADVAPGWDITGGVDYWFTAANVNNGWEWAEALNGATVGTELYNAHSSTGPGCQDGGPHCGPWTDVHTDFAFRIDAVPEPATWAMMIGGFACAGMQMRRRQTKRVSFA